jgi:uncharacterized membrane protein YkvA (DUF1232 family)
MEHKHQDIYKKIRARVEDWLQTKGAGHKYADMILLVPDFFHLLCKLVTDKDVPAIEKAKLAGAIAYFIAPIDVLPEAFIGPLGYLDDLALAAYVLNSLLKSCGEEVILRHWAGKQDVIKTIETVIQKADDMVGSGALKKLKEFINSRSK